MKKHRLLDQNRSQSPLLNPKRKHRRYSVSYPQAASLTASSPPPASVQSNKPRKRDVWLAKLAAGGNGKQRLLMFTAPKETKPLVAALQQEKARGTDIKPLVDGMLATIAS